MIVLYLQRSRSRVANLFPLVPPRPSSLLCPPTSLPLRLDRRPLPLFAPFLIRLQGTNTDSKRRNRSPSTPTLVSWPSFVTETIQPVIILSNVDRPATRALRLAFRHLEATCFRTDFSLIFFLDLCCGDSNRHLHDLQQ